MKKQAAATGKTEVKKQTSTKNKQSMKTQTKKSVSNSAEKLSENDQLIMIDPRAVLVDETTNKRIVYEGIKELADSIVESGLRNAVKVFIKDGKIHLREGFRRMRAINLALSAGKHIEAIPALVDKKELSEQERLLEFFLNNDGHPYTMIEQAGLISDMLQSGMKVTDIVKKTGKARGYIENLIILTKLPKTVYDLIVAGKISAHAVIQIAAALKGDEAALIAAVEEAIKVAEAAGKSKATPKHVKNEKVKGPSHGKFYHYVEDLLDVVAGRKDARKEREEVLSYIIVAYENGQPAKDVAERYLIAKSENAKAQTAKEQNNEQSKLEVKKDAKNNAGKKATPSKSAAKKSTVKKASKKTSKK